MMKPLSSSQQIKYGAVLSYLGIVVYILVGLLYTPWMIRVIGKDDYGLYTLAYSIVALFVFDFGISAAIQRFVAKYLAEGNKEKVNNCISLVYKLYIYIDIAILIILSAVYLLIPYIYRELTVEQIASLKIVFIMAASFSVISFPFIPLNGILSAHEKFVQLKTCDLLSKVLTVGINIVCLYFGGGLYELVLTNVLVGLFIIVLKFVIVKQQTSIKVRIGYKDKNEMRSLLSFSGWTTVVALSQRCIFNIAPSILGMFAGAGVIAILGISISLEAYTYTFACALNGLFLPRISRILNDNGSVLPLMIRVGRIQILTMGVILIGFIVVGRDFISTWLGEGYEEAYICTLLLILPAFLLLPADIADQTLIASGNVKYRAFVYVGMAIINVPLSIVMTKYYGLKGLAFSIFIAYMIRNIALFYVYYSKLHINVFNFFRDSYIKLLPGLCVSFMCAYMLANMVNQSGWYAIAIKAIIVSVCYAVCMALLGINKTERDLVKNVVNKIIK